MVESEVKVVVNKDIIKPDDNDENIYHRIEEKLKNPKTYFAIGLTIFIVFAVIGLAYAEYQIAHEPTQYSHNIKTIARQITHKVNWTSQVSVMLSIFRNNLTVGLLLFTITLISTGLISFLFYIFNGAVLGYVLGEKLSLHSLMLILPHGIIEIPAIVYFGWIGTRFNMIDYLVIENKSVSDYKDNLIPMFKHLLIASSLLLVSAFVEAFITGRLAGLFS